MPLSCYRFGPPQKSDPRATKEHAEAVKNALGLLDPRNPAYQHLRPDDKAAINEVIERNAPAYWVDGARSTLRGYKHDVVPGSSPVRGHPIRLKGDEGKFVRETLEVAVSYTHLTLPTICSV